jgi:hypothetical protein
VSDLPGRGTSTNERDKARRRRFGDIASFAAAPDSVNSILEGEFSVRKPGEGDMPECGYMI